MSKYDDHFNKVLSFANTYYELINCHLVDFLTDNLWEKCLPDALRSELERCETDSNCWAENISFPELNNFTTLTRSLSLESCSTMANVDSLTEILPNGSTIDVMKCKESKREFMNVKKLHEVEVLGNVVASVATSTRNLVIDAGAGKAYLSTFLAENYEIPVLAIDSSRVCRKGAICRQERLQKKSKSSLSTLVRYVVEEIGNETDYSELVSQNFPDWNLNRNLLLTGLHTCGSLAHSVIRAFLHTTDINILCIVPCCYHLTNETFNKQTVFTKNARMLAQQSVERSTEKRSVSPSLFYRAVLQVILQSMGVCPARIGRGGPLNNFSSYAKWALTKIGIEAEKIPSTNDLESVYQSYAYLKKRFDLFQMMRIKMGPVLEAAIMLDRIIYLQNSDQCSRLAVLRLFDPMLSPRRYGIIATK